MPSFFLPSLLLAGASILSPATAINTQLVGTWSTKSGQVLTGPGFYNPVNDSFIEPKHTGISYSFTADGFYEEAYYRAVSNPSEPKCPEAIMQFQHGTFQELTNGSLLLSPFEVDGRQLQSNPCVGDNSVYTRYNQSEMMLKYQVYTDGYTKMTRLDLYKFDGSRMNVMYLAYSPPQMLPTVTMNPTTSATTSGKKAKRTSLGQFEGMSLPLNQNAKHLKREMEESLIHRINLNMVWWAGVGMTLFGGAAYLL